MYTKLGIELILFRSRVGKAAAPLLKMGWSALHSKQWGHQRYAGMHMEITNKPVHEQNLAS